MHASQELETGGRKLFLLFSKGLYIDALLIQVYLKTGKATRESSGLYTGP